MQSSTADEGRRTLSRYRFSADRSTGRSYLEDVIHPLLQISDSLPVTLDLQPDLPQSSQLAHSVHMPSSAGFFRGEAWQCQIRAASSASA